MISGANSNILSRMDKALKPILLFIIIVYCIGFIIAGFYMRYRKKRKVAGITYVVVGLLGAIFGLVYHFFLLH